MDDKKGKYITGKVDQYAKRKGWFFGHFADNDLLKSDLVEISWQKIGNKEVSPQDKHIHTQTVEINIVIAGEIALIIAGKEFTFHKGDFWIIWPQTIVEQVKAAENTELIVVRAPSINDKQIFQ